MLAAHEIDLLAHNSCQDPYAWLGAHRVGQDWQVRVLIPQARTVILMDVVSGKRYPMQNRHHPLFFEVTLGETLPDYCLQVEREWGVQEIIRDPYRYQPQVWGELDIYLFAQGNHQKIYEKLGAHPLTLEGLSGVYFSVWAPNARNVSVLGDFNYWDGRAHQMRRLGDSGVWEVFVPGVPVGATYKYEIKNQDGHIYEKSDPYGYQQEVRPKTGSIVTDLDRYEWQDGEWLHQRAQRDPLRSPISVFEVHLGSWLHASTDTPPEPEAAHYGKTPQESVVQSSEYKPYARYLTYRELAAKLIPYVQELGFTHIELLPVAEHPFDGSWGYQVIGYFAATSRYGSPQDLMYFIDQCHQHGIGVIVDWVPGHFPRDGHGLAFFDGTHLYEYEDPRMGEHKDWGTLIFNYGRHEVRNFLVANALFWFDRYHIDGIRVDAVASMLYLDYSRKEGEWVPNQYGGREHIQAIDFFRQLNATLFQHYPGILSIAEESTSWPMVTWPTHVGGLGFNLKWNMGWMHDMLDYFHLDPWFRQFNHNLVTFSIMYAFSENYMLAFSHDEVVHGKSHMIGKIPGDPWDRFASLRCLYGYMFAHPGKQTLFMGMEFGQWQEWNVWTDLEWSLLQYEPHMMLRRYIMALNHLLRREPALYEKDIEQDGFQWIDCQDHSGVIAFQRHGRDPQDTLIVVCNFAPIVRGSYRIGVPTLGFYQELLNSDAQEFYGRGHGNLGGRYADEWSYHNLPYSVELCLPPLAILILKWVEAPPSSLPQS